MAKESNGEPLTVQGALETLQRLEGLEVGLYRRTEGTTWMLWGFITAGIYFTFGMFGAAFEDRMPVLATFAWVPWVAAGWAATFAIWRAAHLAGGSPFTWRQGRRQSAVYFLVYFVLFWLGFWALHTVGANWDLREPGMVMVVLGLASTGVAFLTECSKPARAMLATVGGVAVLSALALAIYPYQESWHAYAIQTFAGVAVLGGGWFLGGLRLTIKG